MIAAPIAPFPAPNLVSLGDLSPDELRLVLDTALEIKANQTAYNDLLRGKRLGFTLAEISEIVDMYDAAPGEGGQRRRHCGPGQRHNAAGKSARMRHLP